MKLVSVLIFSAYLSVVFSKQQKAYIKYDMRCQAFPNSDVCNIEYKVSPFLLKQVGDITAGLQGTLDGLKQLNVSEDCTNAIRDAMCRVSIPKCDNTSMANVDKKLQDSVCQNKIPNGEKCSEAALKKVLPFICKQIKMMEKDMKQGPDQPRCVKKDEETAKFCPSLSNVDKVMFDDQLNITFLKKTLEGLKQSNLSTACVSSLKEVMCASSNAVCQDKDGGPVVAYIMDRETCEEKMKCFNGEAMFPGIGEGYADDDPEENMKNPGGQINPKNPESDGGNGTNNFEINPGSPGFPGNYNLTNPTLFITNMTDTGFIETNICQQFPFKNASTMYVGLSMVTPSAELDNRTTCGQQQLSAFPFAVLGLGLLVVLLE